MNNRIRPYLSTDIPNEQPLINRQWEPSCSLEEKQELLGHHVRMVAKGLTNGLFIYGSAGGMGKSVTVNRVLASEGINPVIVNSHATALGMYRILYTHRKGKVLFLDDCDSMFSELKVLGLLRSALWGTPRVITYTSSALPDDLPPSFEFESSIIMCANVIPKKNHAFSAVLSRIDCFELRATNDEVLEFMRVIAKTGIAGVTEQEAMQVIDFIDAEAGTRQLSLRLLELACKKVAYARGMGLDWKGLVQTQLNTLGDNTANVDSTANDLACLYRVMEEHPDSPREQQKLWCKMTKKSKATFYRLRKRASEEDAQ